MTPIDITAQWQEDWSSASVVNHTIVTDPTIQQPGFDLTHHTWSLLNHFPTGQGLWLPVSLLTVPVSLNFFSSMLMLLFVHHGNSSINSVTLYPFN